MPNICIFFNMFLFGQVCPSSLLFEILPKIILYILSDYFLNFCLQLHHEAWVRFVILSFIMVGVYAIYGQFHGDPNADETIIYHEAPAE